MSEDAESTGGAELAEGALVVEDCGQHRTDAQGVSEVSRWTASLARGSSGEDRGHRVIRLTMAMMQTERQ